MNPGVAVGHVLRFWRIPDRVIDRINPVCLPFTIAGPATFGSAMSFWIIGTMGLCLARTLSGAMTLTTRPQARLVALVFASWFVLHAFFGLAHSGSEETLREIGETLPFIGMLPLYTGLALTRPERLMLPTGLAVSAGAFSAFAVAVFDLLRGLPRVEGLIGNPGPFAAMSLLLFGYCLVTAARSGGRLRLIAIVAAAAAGASVILSGTRVLWPCLLLLPAIIAMIYAAELRRSVGLRQLAIAGVAAVAVVLATFPVIEQRANILVTEIQTLDDDLDLTRSLDQHVALWTAGISLIRAAPFTGHGLDTAPMMQAEIQELYGKEFALSHFHNAFVDIGVKTGVTGIALLVLMVVLPLTFTAQRRKTEAGRYGFAMMTVLMVTYLSSGISGLMLGHDIMDSVFIFSVAYWGMFAFEADAGTADG